MIQTKRIAILEVILIIFILISGTAVTVTEARYYERVSAVDRARVARPQIRLLAQQAHGDLGTLEPGTSVNFEFSVTNSSAAGEISEVICEYLIAVNSEGSQPSELITNLYWLTEQGDWLLCQKFQDGQFAAKSPLGTTATTHDYMLNVALPAEAEPNPTPNTYKFWITVNAWQSDA